MGKIRTIIVHWVQREDKQNPIALFKDTEIHNSVQSTD